MEGQTSSYSDHIHYAYEALSLHWKYYMHNLTLGILLSIHFIILMNSVEKVLPETEGKQML